MRHRDLGEIRGEVLLFGGPYSNLQALIALIDVARARQIATQNMICTGDVVAYCGAPAQTVELMRNLGCPLVAGNCEIQLASGADACGCGFEEGSACDLLSAGWFGYASRQLSADQKTWLGQASEVLSFHHNGLRYGVIHGGLSDVARFVWPSSPDAVFEGEWQLIEALIGPVDHVIAGHCGIPFVRETAKGSWINAGVIGMPPHDGHPDTRYALLDQRGVRIQTLAYDARGAADDMAQAGLPQGYVDGLRTGYWPSEDVLPLDLRVPSLASG